MTPTEVLAEVLRAGGRVVPDPTRPRLVVPPALKPLVLAHREALRALVLAGEPRATAPPPSRTRQGAYSYPWPDALPGLGQRTVGPFARCSQCRAQHSWVRYGARVLCLACACRRVTAPAL